MEHPRDYCYCHTTGPLKFYFSPISHVVGSLYDMTAEEVRGMINAGQRRQFHRREYGKPLSFPWKDRMLNSDNPYRIFRKSVGKREGNEAILRLRPEKKIWAPYLKGNVLSGKVRSKSSPNETKPRVYEVHMRSAFLGYNNEPELVEMMCTCPQASWVGGEKGGRYSSRIECAHIAAMQDKLWDRTYNMGGKGIRKKEDQPDRGLFNPFRFADNWYYQGGKRRAKHRDFASLQIDMIVARYVGKESYLEINKKSLHFPWIVSDTLKNMIMDSSVSREIIIGGKKRAKSASDADRMAYVFAQMTRILYSKGYKFSGRCLEFGEPAIHFENPNRNVVNIVPRGEDGIFYVARTNPSGIIDPFRIVEEEDPFTLLGKHVEGGKHLTRYDDRTMQNTDARVELPSAFRLPETGNRHTFIDVPGPLKQKWRKSVRKAFPDRARQKLKYTRLLYD